MMNLIDLFEDINYYQGVKTVIKNPEKLSELEATGNYIIEPKYDGLWVSVHTNNRGIIDNIVSRHQKKKTGKGFDHFLEDNIGIPNSVFIGELITTKNKLHIFDIVKYKNKNTMKKDFEDRRKLLQKLNFYNNDIELVPQYKNNFLQHFKEITSQGGEGLVIKKIGKSTPYSAGTRTEEWMKVKPKITMDYVITGYDMSDEGSNKGLIKALHLGLYKNGKLVNVGKVGTFTNKQRKELTDNKNNLSGKVVEVGGNEVFKSGSMRHPFFIKFRSDLKPSDANFEKIQIREEFKSYVHKIPGALKYFEENVNIEESLLFLKKELTEEFKTSIKTTKGIIDIFENPTKKEMREAIREASYGSVRYIIDKLNKKVYIFSSNILHINAFINIYKDLKAKDLYGNKKRFLLGEANLKKGDLVIDSGLSYYNNPEEIKNQAPWAMKYFKGSYD